MKYGVNIFGLQKMNPDDFGDPLFQKCLLVHKKYWNQMADCPEIYLRGSEKKQCHQFVVLSNIFVYREHCKIQVLWQGFRHLVLFMYWTH